MQTLAKLSAVLTSVFLIAGCDAIDKKLSEVLNPKSTLQKFEACLGEVTNDELYEANRTRCARLYEEQVRTFLNGSSASIHFGMFPKVEVEYLAKQTHMLTNLVITVRFPKEKDGNCDKAIAKPECETVHMSWEGFNRYGSTTVNFFESSASDPSAFKRMIKWFEEERPSADVWGWSSEYQAGIPVHE